MSKMTRHKVMLAVYRGFQAGTRLEVVPSKEHRGLDISVGSSAEKAVESDFPQSSFWRKVSSD